jgi:S-adenosyl-L-methionine hydrolase (adenosine-forming)
MAERKPLITLTTDFGESDYFVPAMKGVILSLNPAAEIIDITHQIPPHDIFAAAFTLLCCYRDFPRWTLHTVVVDPGVGSSRRPIMVMTDDYNFIGPDNGVFSYIYQRETVNRVVHLTTEYYFRSPVSNTFHGRDIFAPIAAYVSKLTDWRKLGDEVNDPVRFSTPAPSAVGPGQIRGHVLHVDRFGNIISNITPSELTAELVQRGARIRVGNKDVARIVTHFAEAANNELIAYFGSAGFLEIAMKQQSAAKLVEARRGMEVQIATA